MKSPTCPSRADSGAAGVRLRLELEACYETFARVSFIGTDPIEHVLGFEADRDREVAALVASSLAYGRVRQIRTSVDRVLTIMGSSPSRYLLTRSAHGIRADLKGFRHRFTSSEDLAGLLVAMKRVLVTERSLGEGFLSQIRRQDETMVPAMDRWVAKLRVPRRAGGFGLVPRPRDGSACKRLALFLRWMGRRDRVDPGVWVELAPSPEFLSSRLIVPVDTHMLRVGRTLRFTRRSAGDLTTAIEITAGFRALVPRDPARYDFALTRPGITGVPLRLRTAGPRSSSARRPS